MPAEEIDAKTDASSAHQVPSINIRSNPKGTEALDTEVNVDEQNATLPPNTEAKKNNLDKFDL